MKEFHFVEATPLIDFYEQHKSRIIDQPLNELYTAYWPEMNRRALSDEPIIFKLNNYCLIVYYYLTSDISIVVCDEEELKDNRECERILGRKGGVIDYYQEETGLGEKKDTIEGHIIKSITVERFSEAFEYNTSGDMRPKGGDYFSTIRIHLDSGKALCIRGVEAIFDGYVELWCE